MLGMTTNPKIDVISKFSSLFDSARSGNNNFINNLSNFLVTEFEYQSTVFFKILDNNTFQVIGKSNSARNIFLTGSEFKCSVCKLTKELSTSFYSDSKCEIQISEYLVYEICSKFDIDQNNSILFKIAKKSAFNQTDLDNLKKLSEAIKYLIKIWLSAKGGNLSITEKSFIDIVTETAQGLRNPANSIIGFTSILDEDNLTSSQVEYSRTLKKHAQNLLASVNDLLDLAKYESGKLSASLRRVELKSLVEQSLEVYQDKKQSIQIDFKIKYDENIPSPFVTDPQKLRYIFQTLLNASIALLKKGQLEINFKALSDNQLSVELKTKQGGFFLKEDFNIFKPFAATNLEQLRDTNITGLSFTLVEKYVNMLGGEIFFSATSKKGFKFIFTIKRESMSQLESTLSNLPKPDKHNRVLVIEDDYATSRLMSNYLTKWGYEPKVVNTEEQAFEVIENEPLLAVVLDIELPNTNGLELLKKINEHPNTKNTPVIVAAVEADQQKAYMMGAVEYFVKPINYNYLVEVLTSYKLRKDSNILCVDDDLPTLNLLKQAVNTAGYYAVAENISSKVMDLIKDKDIDLAIIDLDMPHPNGFELIKMIKSEKRFANLPIIIYTGKENYQEDLKQIDGLFEDLLNKKSTNIEDLQEIMNSMINRYETPPPAEEVIKKKDVVKILLAEDYKHSQIIVTRLLKKNNFENVIVVDNGEDALNYAKKETFDLILMDMQMPIMNGFEATESIRRLEGYKDTPIIALTAFAMKGDREKCLEAGATDYIPKPIDSKEFIEKVKYYTKSES